MCGDEHVELPGSVSDASTRERTKSSPTIRYAERIETDFVETRELRKVTDVDGNKHVNEYLIMEELGVGAYGKVRRVLNTTTKEHFAIKIFDKKLLRRKRVGRFSNALSSVAEEVAIWKLLKHDNIVQLFEVIDTNDSDNLYMISELVDGGPVLTEGSYFPEDTCKTYFVQLIEGLAFLHFHKIIHRDIKPSNLLVDGNGKLKITDFGVSKMFEGDDAELRQTAGTAPFLAPEMLTGELFKGKPVDVWAVGITLYLLIYGTLPFQAKTVPEMYEQIRTKEITYPPETAAGIAVSPSLIDLLQNVSSWVLFLP